MSTRIGFVDFNGNRYDTASGQIISAIKTSNKKRNQVIDGFVRAPQKLAARKMVQNSEVKSAAERRQIKSAEFHKQAEKAHTLMRDGLKKPVNDTPSSFARLSSSPRIERELRAKLTPKHLGVNRFGGHLRPAKPQNIADANKHTVSGEIINRRSHSQAKASQATAAPLPSMIASASHQKLERLLDEALFQADAHKQALRYHAAKHFWQRRWFSGPKRWLFIAAVFFVFIGGIIAAWQKIPQVSMRVAGIRAHLTPVVPSYIPDGYSMAGPAKAASGAVMVNYQSSGGSGYTINQAQSNLTSTSLAQSVIPKGASVQTSQVEGNTVYIYGNDNDAAWVNNGVLYTIKDHADLSSDELIKIVQGLNP